MVARKDVLWGMSMAAMVVALGIYISPPARQVVLQLWGSPRADERANTRAGTSAAISLAAVERELVKFAEANKISDPVQRCLAYPTPPEFHWDVQVVQASCQLWSRKRPELSDIDAALAQGQPRALQLEYDDYLAKTYTSGNHGLLIYVYKQSFTQTNALATIQRWIDADPNSAYALAARGIHYVSAAFAARGEKLAADTPPENFERMREHLAKARVDLEESLRRNPRLIASYHGLIEVAKLLSDRDLLDRAAKQSLALDPADQAIYTVWMNAVEPKWGGSLLEMEEVIQAAQEHSAENPLLGRLAARPLCSRAEQATDAKEAFELYRRAGAMTPAPCFLNEAGNAAERAGALPEAVLYYTQTYRFLGSQKSLSRRSYVLQQLGKREWALDSLEAELERDPKSVEVLNGRGWALMNAQRIEEGEASFQAALRVDPTNREAASELFAIYFTLRNQPAKAREIADQLMARAPDTPRPWLLQGLIEMDTDPAKSRLALQKYLGMVDQECCDSYELRDIQRAKAVLKQLDSKGH